MNGSTYVAIMAGGIGSRFWPVSRVNYPKQFLDILGTGQTLIQETFNRFKKLVPVENIFIITSDDYVSIVQDQLPALPAKNIIGEPYRKNTAPCIAYIAFKLLEKDPFASLIIAPSDHLILQEENFIDVCINAFNFVRTHNTLVTIGIKPTHPNTGYGYIQRNEKEIAPSVYKVKLFTEKPDLNRAKSFLESGDFLWNSGIFIWKVSDILEAFQKYLPDMYQLFSVDQEHLNTDKEKEIIEGIFNQCIDISIDFGIMEKADNVYVIPASFGWSDLGTWNSAWENMDKDERDNAVAGENILIIDATKCVVHAADNRLIVLQGLDEFIVVDTSDVLLICRKEKEQEIKKFVSEVKSKKGAQFLYTADSNNKGWYKAEKSMGNS